MSKFHMVKHYILAKVQVTGSEESRVYNAGRVDGIELSLAIMGWEKEAHEAYASVKAVLDEKHAVGLAELKQLIGDAIK